MMDERKARTWAEVDLDALAHNYRALRAILPQGCRFLGVVKADAYGHGAVAVGRTLQALGADMLAVACLSEGRQLRQAGIGLPVLCLGHTPPELAGELLALDITQTVDSLEHGLSLSEAAAAAGRRLKIHVKVDTGMGRLGFRWDGGGRAAEQIARLCALPGLEPEGLFTHFAAADGDEGYTMDQLARFQDARQALERRGARFQIYHCGASAAVLHYPCTHMDMVRPGIALYGHWPDPDRRTEGLELRPVMQVLSRISAVREMPEGAPVSYGCTVALARPSRLAVLPIGYGDGLPRVLSNKLRVKIGGRDCPILGRICMDMCMADVTGLPQVRAGDVAQIYGPELTDRAARQADTISYELLTALSPRVPRIYRQGGAEL